MKIIKSYKRFLKRRWSNVLIFESPVSKRIINYVHLNEKNKFYLSLPRIRFYAVCEFLDNNMWVRNLNLNFIGSNNVSYPAILPNIDAIGSVCFGSMDVVYSLISKDDDSLISKDDDEVINKIYSSFLSSSFNLSGRIWFEFLYFKSKINRNCNDSQFIPSNANIATIEFFEKWEKDGLEFQDRMFLDIIKNTYDYNHLNWLKDQDENFKTYMELG